MLLYLSAKTHQTSVFSRVSGLGASLASHVSSSARERHPWVGGPKPCAKHTKIIIALTYIRLSTFSKTLKG